MTLNLNLTQTPVPPRAVPACAMRLPCSAPARAVHGPARLRGLTRCRAWQAGGGPRRLGARGDAAGARAGLYAERTGAINFVLADAGAAKRVLSQVKRIARAMYSNPPVHGAPGAAPRPCQALQRTVVVASACFWRLCTLSLRSARRRSSPEAGRGAAAAGAGA